MATLALSASLAPPSTLFHPLFFFRSPAAPLTPTCQDTYSMPLTLHDTQSPAPVALGVCVSASTPPLPPQSQAAPLEHALHGDSPAMCLMAWQPMPGGSLHKNGKVAVWTWRLGKYPRIWDRFGNPILSQRHSNMTSLFFDFYFDRGNVQR